MINLAYGRNLPQTLLDDILLKAQTNAPRSEHRIRKNYVERLNGVIWRKLCQHAKRRDTCQYCKTLCKHMRDKNECLKCERTNNPKKREPKNYDPNIVRKTKRTRKKTNNKNKRLGIDSIEHNHFESVRKLQALLETDYDDKRKANACCFQCKRIYLAAEKFYQIDIDEMNYTKTTYRVNHKESSIYWTSPCVSCLKSVNQQYSDDNFTNVLARSTMITHLNGTLTEQKQYVNNIRKRDNDTCQSCGIYLIAKPKSGWRKMSLNDKHPDRRMFDKNANIKDIRLSCLACNYYQHKLPWKIFKEILILTKEVIILPYLPDYSNTFCDSLESIYLSWIDRARDINKCPPEIRRLVINRDHDICRLTGVKVRFESGYWNTASFDRIDSSLPYTLENTQLVTKHANYVKVLSITFDEFNAWLNHIRTN